MFSNNFIFFRCRCNGVKRGTNLHGHVYLTDFSLLLTSIGLVIITAIGVIFYKNSERNLPWILFLMVAMFWTIGEIVWSQDFQYEAGDPLSYLSEIF